MDGLKDLYRAPDNHVFSERSLEVVPEGKPKKNLYCGWKFIKITEEGLPLYTDGCDATPDEPCRHVMTFLIEEVHFFVRALRIALFSLRSHGLSQTGEGGKFIRHRGSTDPSPHSSSYHWDFTTNGITHGSF
jgi:hypothetical protein